MEVLWKINIFKSHFKCKRLSDKEMYQLNIPGQYKFVITVVISIQKKMLTAWSR